MLLQNNVSLMKREMKELEDKAAASAKATLSEKEQSLQLEKDLKKFCAELEDVKRGAAQTNNVSQKAIKDLNTGLDCCRKGIKAMTQRVYGKQHSSFFYLCLILCLSSVTV